MRSPEDLGAVDWASLTHAYGGAADVPQPVRALYSDDPEAVDEALYELFGNVLHQGSVYPATVEAVPFPTHAVVHARYKRDWLLMLLAEMAGGEAPDCGRCCLARPRRKQRDPPGARTQVPHREDGFGRVIIFPHDIPDLHGAAT
ncbi:hypothetical protein LK07_28335 [Streptomyces pluripotens]|uniref:Uncharacterized protein n=1 Tax=Streptomyces pluripotens TaxID=1355015 RepID=A0A221P5B8_9ACTN|nr:hypothetical protein [Streptomyces pluripotens]ARP73045.1 hypothetical protein LK06_027165 [Streptomyces pluripotens]ASN27296.1 hypothetical protein LK07_28335 [Streptomyces pluripotens]